jgi:hypothetical protein
VTSASRHRVTSQKWISEDEQLAKSKLPLVSDAIAELDAELDCPEDVRDIEAKLDAIASALIASGLYRSRVRNAAIPLPTILKQLVKKYHMAPQAVDAAEFLMELSRREHYLDDIDDDSIGDAESKRQSLVKHLRDFLNRVENQ